MLFQPIEACPLGNRRYLVRVELPEANLFRRARVSPASRSLPGLAHGRVSDEPQPKFLECPMPVVTAVTLRRVLLAASREKKSLSLGLMPECKSRTRCSSVRWSAISYLDR